MFGTITMTSALWLFVFVFLLLPLVDAIRRWRMSVRLNLPSGPIPWPLFGNIGILRQLETLPEQTCMYLARKFGDICLIWFGNGPVVIVNSAKAAYDLFHVNAAHTASRPEQNDFRQTICQGRLVLTPVGAEFRLIRKIYHSLLSPSCSSSFNSYQDQDSNLLLLEILQNPSEFYYATERFALSILFSGVYGIRLDTLSHPMLLEFYHIWEQLMIYFRPGTLPIDIFPVLMRLPHWLQPWRKLANRIVGREHELYSIFLDHLREAELSGSAPDCFGLTLLKWKKAENIDDDMVLHMCSMLTGAGSDTTSTTLQAFFKIMALHPEVVRKAHEELDNVVGTDRLPVWADELQLPYVRALIKEVHRWAPIATLGVPHATTADINYGDRMIPRGTILFPNLLALSRDEDRYPQAELFEPKRFLGDDREALASAQCSDYKQRDHFHYGFGRRLCQGIYVAESSLYIAIVRTLWAFDIDKVPGEHLDMFERTGGFLKKQKPFQIRIKSRGQKYEEVIRSANQGPKLLRSLEEIKPI